MATKFDHVTLAPAQKPASRFTWSPTENAEVIRGEVKKARLAAMVLLGLASVDGLNGDDLVDPIATIASALYEIEYCAGELASCDPKAEQ
jgi:hypothetical protein